MRDTLTNKRISNNKEVVCIENAIDYVKKQGYLVIRPKYIQETIYMISFFLTVLLMISIVSAGAGDLGSSKTYNATIKEITFKDNLSVTIATAKLDTPLINYVTRGNDILVAEFTMDMKKDNYLDAIKNMAFLDLNDKNKQISRPYSYKKKTISLIDSDRIDNVCSDKGKREVNGSIKLDCELKLIKEKKEVITWEKLDKIDLTKGNTTIGIFANVYPGDKIEWGMDIVGINILDVWGVWQESYNNGLVYYFKFDNATSNATATFDSIGIYPVNGTLKGNISGGKNCKIGECFYYDGTADNITIGQDSHIRLATNFTIGMWVKLEDLTNPMGIFSRMTMANRDYYIWLGAGDSNPGQYYVVESLAQSVRTKGNLKRADWQFIVARQNDTAQAIFENGTQISSTTGGPVVTTAIDTLFGWNCGGFGACHSFQGWIDEAFMYNRSLSDSEILIRYNSGAGMTWLPPDTTYPTFSAYYNSPANNSYFIDGNYTFRVTITNTNGSAWITINGTNRTMTNASGVYTALVPLLTANSTYNYSYWAYGSGSANLINSSGMRTFVIGSTAPVAGNIFFNIDLTTTQGILVFIIFLVIAILTLLFIHYEMGCFFLMIDGFIAIVSYDNKMLGLMIIVVSIVLTFAKQK